MIYLSKVKESWIVDRIRKEWYLENKEISTKHIKKSKIIWLIAPWLWKKIPSSFLTEKKVVCSIYHIVDEKFDQKQKEEFMERDRFVDCYHTISEPSRIQLSKLTNKKVYTIPLWVNQNIWFNISDKEKLRDKYKFSKDDFLVGSFQRDTEGSDLISPKLEKGPDIFVESVKKLSEKTKNVKVILTGKRRQYIISELQQAGIPYSYFKMVDFKKLNQLYNILNLYIVSSRVEGGPQSIVECGLIKTPIISRDVGVAREILNSNSIFENTDIFDASPDIEHAYRESKKLIIPDGMDSYKKMFTEIYEN